MIIRRFYFTRSVHVNRHEGSVQVRGSRPQAQQTYLCEFIHAGVHPLKPRHLIACGTLHVHGPPLRRSRGGELALHFFATTKVGAYYYVLSSLGMLTAATAVEAWGKRPRKAAGATPAPPAAPLLQ